MRTCAIGLTVLLVAAGAAAEPNVTFSFASDNNSDGPTFTGDANTGSFGTLRNDVGLLVDDANGPLPTLSFDTLFYADFDLTHDSSVTLGTGQTLHAYRLDGTFRFDAQRTMSVSIVNGLFTTLGDADSWGSSASIQASSDAGSTVTYTWTAADQAAYNLFQDASTQDMTDAAFTLTNILSGSQSGVDLDPQTLLPNAEWQSEGSYSGSAFFIPAPASLVMLGAGTALAVRRRR